MPVAAFAACQNTLPTEVRKKLLPAAKNGKKFKQLCKAVIFLAKRTVNLIFIKGIQREIFPEDSSLGEGGGGKVIDPPPFEAWKA